MNSDSENSIQKGNIDRHMNSCEAIHHKPLRPTLLNIKFLREKLASISISRREILTLIHKTLEAQGFNDIADILRERALGSTEHNGGHYLISLIKSNSINTAIAAVPSVLAKETPELREKACELLLRYHFRSIVEEGNQIEALRVIRENYYLLRLESHETFLFTLPLMFPQGSAGETINRSSLSVVDAINELLPCTACTDPNRLEQLLKYAMIYQREQCLLHSSPDYGSLNYTLFRDHFCDGSFLPSRIAQRSELTNSSAWQIQFSHNGKYIGVCLREKALLLFHRLDHLRAWVWYKRFAFTNVPAFFRWSPDDSMILVVTACGRYMIFMSNLEVFFSMILSNSECVVSSRMINETVTCVDWFSDNRRYVVATIDGNVYVSNLEGDIIQSLHGFRTTALMVVDRGCSILMSDHMKRLVLWSLVESTTRCVLQNEDLIHSISPSPDPNEILFSQRGKGVFLFSLRYLSIIRSFPAVKLHGTGSLISFMPGSEAKIFCAPTQLGHLGYWHIEKSEPLKIVNNPSKPSINSVSWSPADRHSVVTTSDDGLITIWRSVSADLF